MTVERQALRLLERTVDLLERMDPERRGDRPHVTDEHLDALSGEIHRLLCELAHAQLRQMLLQMYTAGEVDEWISTPQQLLGGRTAHEMIAAGEWPTVEAVVQRRLDGVYL